MGGKITIEIELPTRADIIALRTKCSSFERNLMPANAN